MNTRTSCKWLKVSDGDNRDSPVILHISVAEVKFPLVGVVKIIFHYHDEVVRLVTLLRVVQPGLFVFNQVAVFQSEKGVFHLFHSNEVITLYDLLIMLVERTRILSSIRFVSSAAVLLPVTRPPLVSHNL